MLKNIEYFKIKNYFSENDLREIACQLEYIRFDKNEKVVNYNELCQNFYIIMKGEISVEIPN